MGRKDYFGPGILILRAPEPGFIFFGRYSPGFFSNQDHAYKNKEFFLFTTNVHTSATNGHSVPVIIGFSDLSLQIIGMKSDMLWVPQIVVE